MIKSCTSYTLCSILQLQVLCRLLTQFIWLTETFDLSPAAKRSLSSTQSVNIHLKVTFLSIRPTLLSTWAVKAVFHSKVVSVALGGNQKSYGQRISPPLAWTMSTETVYFFINICAQIISEVMNLDKPWKCALHMDNIRWYHRGKRQRWMWLQHEIDRTCLRRGADQMYSPGRFINFI